MEHELASRTISHHLEPWCPRDDPKMKFDADGVRWEQAADNATFKVATTIAGMADAPSVTLRSMAISRL